MKHAAELIFGTANPIIKDGKVTINLSEEIAVDEGESITNKHCSELTGGDCADHFRYRSQPSGSVVS